MKQLLLLTLFAVSISISAQKVRTIEKPYCEFRNSGLFNVSKVEISPKETRLHVYCTFLPKWWITFDKDETIIDAETKEEYKIIAIEGGAFDKKIWTPASGDTTIVLTFPPLNKKVKKIDYIDNVYGISLDPNLAGKQPLHMVSREIRTWIDEALAKNQNQPLKDYHSEDFFKNGTGKIVGCIKGYSKDSDIKTGIIYLSNYLTREDYPIVVEVQDDGRFEADLPLISPIYTYMALGKAIIPFYLEQGQTLGMIIDWNDYLKADRYRNVRYDFKATEYYGPLGIINSQLLAYNFEYSDYRKEQNLLKKMNLDEQVKYYSDKKDMELSKLEFHSKMKKPNAKTYQILLNEILLKNASSMYSLARNRKFEARKDTANHELQKPLPDSFYKFLTGLPIGEQSICVNNSFRSFVNDYEYSDLIMSQRTLASKEQAPSGFFNYLLENEKNLTDQHREYALLMDKTSKSKKDLELIQKQTINFQKLAEAYGDSFEAWKKRMALKNSQADVRAWELAYNVIKEQYGVEKNLTHDIAKIRSLDFRFKNLDKTNAQLLWGNMKETITHEYLLATGDKLFKKHFDDANQGAYVLPDGKATEIFKKIIDPHKEKILFIDFWATTCGPCVGGIKRMKATREKYADNKDFDFIFITDERGSPEKAYSELVKEQELKNTYRISADEYLYLRQLFKFNGIPRYVVIDKEGRVSNDNFSMYNFETELKKMLKTESPSI